MGCSGCGRKKKKSNKLKTYEKEYVEWEEGIDWPIPPSSPPRIKKVDDIKK